MYIVILAGGGGTRLWPLSTPERPKPFLPLLLDGASLFQRTVQRLRGSELAGFDLARDLYVIVDGRFAELARGQAQAIAPGLHDDHVLAEPTGRNTAAAIALAATAIQRDDDEVMVVLPADHLIPEAKEEAFRGVIDAAGRELASGFRDIPEALVTLGIQTSRPATEYGYLRPDLDSVVRGRLTGYRLKAFIEKPEPAQAAHLITEPGVAWNAGMFLWRRRAIRRAFETYPKAAPIWAQVEAGQRTGDLAAAYERLAPMATSIDYAVMEPAAAAGEVVMGSMDVGWSDLGSWRALLDALGAPGIDGRVVKAGDIVEFDGGDLLVDREGWPADGQLHLRHGPATMGPFDRPTASLPDAARHEQVVSDLLARVNQGGLPA